MYSYIHHHKHDDQDRCDHALEIQTAAQLLIELERQHRHHKPADAGNIAKLVDHDIKDRSDQRAQEGAHDAEEQIGFLRLAFGLLALEFLHVARRVGGAEPYVSAVDQIELRAAGIVPCFSEAQRV